VLFGALVALSLLGDVWRAGHLLVVRHSACPYDGALVHDDELPDEVATGAREARDGAAVSPRHEHHGCDVLGAIQRPTAILSAFGAAVPELEPQADERCLVETFEVRREVLSYAPRLPPPA
jgi:hypothetical protein